jgi:signal transduction histidine kinase/GAF domain-containing protein
MPHRIIQLFQEMTNTPGESSSLKAVMEKILSMLIVDICKVYKGAIGKVGDDRIEYEVCYGYPYLTIPLHQGLTRFCIASRDILYEPDVTQNPQHMNKDNDHRVQSELIIPIIHGDKVVGVINLHSDKVNGFDEAHTGLSLDWYRTIGYIISLIWINLDEQEQHRKLHRVGANLNGILQIEQLPTAICRYAIEFVDCEKVFVISYPQTTRLKSAVIHSYSPLDEDNKQTFLFEKLPLLDFLYNERYATRLTLNNYDKDYPLGSFRQLKPDIQHVLCIPMHRNVMDVQQDKHPIGVICLARTSRQKPFTVRDIHTLSILAGYAGVSWDVASKYEERTRDVPYLSQLPQKAANTGVWQSLVNHINEILRRMLPDKKGKIVVAFYRHNHIASTKDKDKLTLVAATVDEVFGSQFSEVTKALQIVNKSITHNEQKSILTDVLVPEGGYSTLFPAWEWDNETAEATFQLVGILSIRHPEVIGQNEIKLIYGLIHEAINTYYYMEQSERLQQLVKLNHDISRLQPRQTLKRIVEESRKLVEADCVVLYEAQSFGGLEFKRIYPEEFESNEPESSEVLKNYDVRIISLFNAADAEKSNQLKPFNFTNKFDAPPAWREIANWFYSLLIVPIWDKRGGRYVLRGAIMAACKRSHAFNRDKKLAFEALATQASILFQNEEREMREKENRIKLRHAADLLNRLHDYNRGLKRMKELGNMLRDKEKAKAVAPEFIVDATENIVHFIDMYDKMKQYLDSAQDEERSFIKVEDFTKQIEGNLKHLLTPQEQDGKTDSWKQTILYEITPVDLSCIPPAFVSQNIYSAIEIILNNAIEALEKVDSRKISVHLSCNEQSLFGISITDTGVGMDEEVIARVFEFGFSRKDRANQHSMGIGMWLAQIIVENNAGTIKVDEDYTKPGRGARIVILLPSADSISK